MHSVVLAGLSVYLSVQANICNSDFGIRIASEIGIGIEG